jgi:hypothetical protein
MERTFLPHRYYSRTENRRNRGFEIANSSQKKQQQQQQQQQQKQTK